MREIKFRVWDKEQKKMWVHEEDTGINFDKMNGVGGYYYNHGVECCEDFVLMQYTGLKDKNDKEIYEADIVIIDDGDDWEVGRDIVKFKNAKFQIDGSDIDERIITIIGNIKENPELIKEKTNE